MKWQSVIRSFGFLGLLVFLPPAFAAEGEAFTESVVIFNTICAKCHEAQCSGRLSFDQAFEKSSSHVLRHYGQASGKQWLQKELFDILNFMKEKCAYYPIQTPIPSKRIWKTDILDKFTTFMERNYFIPLGHFTPGQYRIELELEKDAKVITHLISGEFEMALEDCYLSTDRRVNIPVRIEEPGDYYFRMYPKTPVRILRFSILPQESNGQQGLKTLM
ncbi:hypothetical protein [endosymbiont of Lamellibrachia barhami]|uniref:hypothetical protein n=1 Tax=endosymbiont of Lamellibrachia barhami TaxID=205975 RepID=UPI0015B0DA80|nr:hypothetical protein [endosymbiont of Lamellibrachia barhami]